VGDVAVVYLCVCVSLVPRPGYEASVCVCVCVFPHLQLNETS